MTALHTVPTQVLLALVDDLIALDVQPLHLHIDTLPVGDQRPDIRLWLRTRTDFERACTHWGIKATEKRYSPAGQREWSATKDVDEHRLLVQVVSFQHHPDWQPRPQETR